ncbi:hypothetical protein A2U01_0107097, partial [Trifolium medium]|nr:hypothetical protein [Trifolium medium]
SPNPVDLDARLTKKEREEEKLEDKEPGTEKIYRPIPDGDFEIIPLARGPLKRNQDRYWTPRLDEETA